ncbi:WD40/YVTN/BNR-like repeat-containing protein [Paraburkholderia adhaesiva]|uniref:WD40/YVTN/BNR-like repeat-containing protein n=1 Tax=Paraburkholderia adhaesiva TaxID=2883244 RepID=UPI001F4304DA|nr:exo-alpha-sialidase [Paraburkholderia adhaesiva]
MTDRLLVATRKGLFELHADDQGRWTLGEPQFIGEPVSMVLADPRDGSLYAALNLGHFGVKLHRRRAGSADWEECAVPVYPPQPPEETRVNDGANPSADDAAASRPPVPWTLQQIWSLEPGGPDEPGVLWAGTIPGGLFRSGDGGDTWELNRALWDRPERLEWAGGGYDAPGIHSVLVDPRDSRHITIGVSSGGVWQTADGGATWRQGSDGMEADYMPPERRGDPNVQDPHHVVQCPANPDVLWTQHHCGIFRSTDGATHWQRIEAQPSSFGFAVAVHPREPDTAWFVPAVKDQYRVPVDGKFVVTRTRDGGRTFERFSNGLPPVPAYDLVYRHGLDVDESGTRLAMGSTTGGLWTSADGGESWDLISAHLPPVYCVRFG